MVLAGTVAMEDMGFKIFGFVGGRADDWEPHLVYWGPEADMLGRERYDAEGKLENPLAATTMGLIYVNPEGPGGNPDPLAAADTVPDAQLAGGSHAPIMFTTDLALKFDPTYREISKRFLDNADEFELAFAKAWFKLTHRDMGPRALYLGDEVPEAVLLWQDPVPAVDHALIDESDIAELKQRILAFGLTTGELVRTAWASASSFRASDMRGGANGGRIRLAP